MSYLPTTSQIVVQRSGDLPDSLENHLFKDSLPRPYFSCAKKGLCLRESDVVFDGEVSSEHRRRYTHVRIPGDFQERIHDRPHIVARSQCKYCSSAMSCNGHHSNELSPEFSNQETRAFRGRKMICQLMTCPLEQRWNNSTSKIF